MNLFNEMKEMGLPVESSNAKVHCKLFEENLGAIEIAGIPKFHPRTKNLNCRLHHLRSYFDDTKEMSIHNIDTLNQPEELLTKPLNYTILIKFCKMVMGW